MTAPPDEADSVHPAPSRPAPHPSGLDPDAGAPPRGVRQRTAGVPFRPAGPGAEQAAQAAPAGAGVTGSPLPQQQAEHAVPDSAGVTGSLFPQPQTEHAAPDSATASPFPPPPPGLDATAASASGQPPDLQTGAQGDDAAFGEYVPASDPAEPDGDNTARTRRLKIALAACGAAVTIGMGAAIALLMEEGNPPLRLGGAGPHTGAHTGAMAPQQQQPVDSSGTSATAAGQAGAGTEAAEAGQPGMGSAEAACPLPGGAAACPTMVAVPAGRYRIGARRNDPDAQEEELGGTERPVAAFELSAHEITAGQWQLCVNDGACPAPAQPAESSAMPVTGISWDAATAYTAWLSRKTGRTYRLPTELEWEYAARAGGTTTFPWGERLGQRNAHCGQCGTLASYPRFAPVGTYPPRNGLYDMVGNAYEWVADCWTGNHAQPLPPAGSGCRDKVQKGGAYDTLEADVRPVARTHGDRATADPRVGFRVARDPLTTAAATARVTPRHVATANREAQR